MGGLHSNSALPVIKEWRRKHERHRFHNTAVVSGEQWELKWKHMTKCGTWHQHSSHGSSAHFTKQLQYSQQRVRRGPSPVRRGDLQEKGFGLVPTVPVFVITPTHFRLTPSWQKSAFLPHVTPSSHRDFYGNSLLFPDFKNTETLVLLLLTNK